MDTTTLYLWLIATLAIIAIVLIIRHRKTKRSQPLTKPKLELEDLFAGALAIAAAISSGQLIYKALTVQELQKLLGAENIPVLVLGGSAVIWISVKEILKLL